MADIDLNPGSLTQYVDLAVMIKVIVIYGKSGKSQNGQSLPLIPHPVPTMGILRTRSRFWQACGCIELNSMITWTLVSSWKVNRMTGQIGKMMTRSFACRRIDDSRLTGISVWLAVRGSKIWGSGVANLAGQRQVFPF